ncbi:hypothetical protein [Actinoplanes regularis]|uniref:hypothetical protein n=1 Tax=Actinoplanes regularis TaxID=52697 RepID=UPI0024A1214F|nr:hypothetical protein [Actinoplanes regularis]GLW35060.1 hypothetical protein Areg01_79960 [Actinoplanes regularis]
MEIAVQRLRMAAIDRLEGRHVGSDQLIQVGLDALLAGVDAPSLPLLAALGRSEEPDAPELFDRVVDELRLAPVYLPAEGVPRAWVLILWWARLMVDGDLDVRAAGHYIYWCALSDIPDAELEPLRPLISSLVRYDDEATSWAVWDVDRPVRLRAAAADVIEQARTLLMRYPQGPTP